MSSMSRATITLEDGSRFTAHEPCSQALSGSPFFQPEFVVRTPAQELGLTRSENSGVSSIEHEEFGKVEIKVHLNARCFVVEVRV
jgi:hypothetical protein